MSNSSIDLLRPARLISFERIVVWVLGIAAAAAILVTVGIVLSLSLIHI